MKPLVLLSLLSLLLLACDPPTVIVQLPPSAPITQPQAMPATEDVPDMAKAPVVTPIEPGDMSQPPVVTPPAGDMAEITCVDIIPHCENGPQDCCNGADLCLNNNCWATHGHYCNTSGVGVQVACWNSNWEPSTCGWDNKCT